VAVVTVNTRKFNAQATSQPLLAPIGTMWVSNTLLSSFKQTEIATFPALGFLSSKMQRTGVNSGDHLILTQFANQEHPGYRPIPPRYQLIKINKNRSLLKKTWNYLLVYKKNVDLLIINFSFNSKCKKVQ